jgi:hypothetical protein
MAVAMVTSDAVPKSMVIFDAVVCIWTPPWFVNPRQESWTLHPGILGEILLTTTIHEITGFAGHAGAEAPFFLIRKVLSA